MINPLSVGQRVTVADTAWTRLAKIVGREGTVKILLPYGNYDDSGLGAYVDLDHDFTGGVGRGGMARLRPGDIVEWEEK